MLGLHPATSAAGVAGLCGFTAAPSSRGALALVRRAYRTYAGMKPSWFVSFLVMPGESRASILMTGPAEVVRSPGRITRHSATVEPLEHPLGIKGPSIRAWHSFCLFWSDVLVGTKQVVRIDGSLHCPQSLKVGAIDFGKTFLVGLRNEVYIHAAHSMGLQSPVQSSRPFPTAIVIAGVLPPRMNVYSEVR